MTLPFANAETKDEAPSNEQPDSWTAHRSETGIVYYYNALTGESTYEKPSAFRGEVLYALGYLYKSSSAVVLLFSLFIFDIHYLWCLELKFCFLLIPAYRKISVLIFLILFSTCFNFLSNAL